LKKWKNENSKFCNLADSLFFDISVHYWTSSTIRLKMYASINDTYNEIYPYSTFPLWPLQKKNKIWLIQWYLLRRNKFCTQSSKILKDAKTLYSIIFLQSTDSKLVRCNRKYEHLWKLFTIPKKTFFLQYNMSKWLKNFDFDGKNLGWLCEHFKNHVWFWQSLLSLVTTSQCSFKKYFEICSFVFYGNKTLRLLQEVV